MVVARNMVVIPDKDHIDGRSDEAPREAEQRSLFR
jgi:hypothetical protein